MSRASLHCGDVRQVLSSLPAESVQCVVTSPPYWGLRDYGTATWEGGDPSCDHVRPTGTILGKKSETFHGSNTQAAHHIQFSGTCGKCQAVRVDNQLGLERTPEEYVANMVAVFREVRRVLRPDGVCWLNIGDSYASGTIGRNDDATMPRPKGGHRIGTASPGKQGSRPRPDGLKAKDLVGIPWRVARALQEPYYTGTIKNVEDRIWLAAMLDAEGCIHIHKRKAGDLSGSRFTRKDGTEINYTRTQDTYGVMVSLDNTSKEIVDRCAAIMGEGSRYTHKARTGKQQRKQTLYRVTVTGKQSRRLIRELYPHLVAKRHQARIAYNAPSSGNGAAEAWEAVKALHGGEAVAVDYPAPPTLFEPGWWLRSDVIWSKLNPMPESVTDRPTRSHEYLFLLTKSQTYYYNSAAIAEPGVTAVAENYPARSRIIGRGGLESLEQSPAGAAQQRSSGGFPPRERGHERPHQGFNGRWDSMPKAEQCGYLRNARSVWSIATQPYADAHFAVFPEELARRCIMAGSKPGDMVLDPFGGSGTVASVATGNGRDATYIDLNPKYLDLARHRIGPMFCGEVA